VTTVAVVNTKTGAIVGDIRGVRYPVARLLVSPNDRVFLAEWGGNAGVMGTINLFDLLAGREITHFKVPEWSHLLGFAPDGKNFLVGGAPFVVYSSKTGKAVRSLSPLGDHVEWDWAVLR
jgi:WD40 repeat protein